MGRGDTQGFDSSSPAACRTPCGRFHKDCLPRAPLHHCGHVSSLGPCMWPGPAGHDHCHRMSGATLAEPVSQSGRGESGRCSDMTSTHGAWRHAGVRFLLSGGCSCRGKVLSSLLLVPLRAPFARRGESGWCSDVTSTHGAWRHAGVRFLLSGAASCRRLCICLLFCVIPS